MYNRAEIKKQARLAMKGKWFKGFLVCLCVALIGVLPNLPVDISMRITGGEVPTLLNAMVGLTFVILIFVSLPLSVSVAFYFVRLFRGESPSFGSAFGAFSPYPGYTKCLAGMLWVTLWLTLWYLLVIPGIFIMTLLTLLFDIIGMIAGTIIMIALLIPFMIKAFAYTFAPYIIADYPELGAKQALNMSKVMTDGYKWKICVMQLSFILWILLAIVTFGIALIYVTPYQSTAFAGMYEKVKQLGIEDGRLRGFPSVSEV